MTKKISVFIIIFCIVTGVQAGLNEPLQNGTFDDGLTGWEYTSGVFNYIGEALLEEPLLDGEIVLSQTFLMPENVDKLTFSVVMTISGGGAPPETDSFYITLDGDNILPFDPYDPLSAYLSSSDIIELANNNDPRIQNVFFDEWGFVTGAEFHDSVTVDVSGMAGQNVELAFTLNHEFDEFTSSVILDDVLLSEIQDQDPPAIETGEMMELWPPNHKYRQFRLSDCVTVVDEVDGPIDLDTYGRILSIYSDEPEEIQGRGDGTTTDDIVINDDISFQVRAERQGDGNGRVYGVTFEVQDSSGNTAVGTFYLGVPHDKSGEKAVDDGPESGYTVDN